MRAITPRLVDEVWREIVAYPPDRVQAEAEAFLAQQPHVAAFAHTVTERFDEAVQNAAVGLGFLLFKILEASVGGPFPAVAEARIRTAHEAVAEWLAQWEGADARTLLEGVEGEGHRSLITHILSVFYAGDAQSPAYDEEVKARLFVLLKTLTEAVDLGEVET